MEKRTKFVMVEILGNHFLLLPERAALWLEQRYLLIADPHFGKAASFRAKGIALPSGTTRDDLERLSALILTWRPQAVVILGDLLHSAAAKTQETRNWVKRWRKKWAQLPIMLVQGNHDRSAGEPLVEFRIDCVQNMLRKGPFLMSHAPPSNPLTYAISGHVHPAVRLSGSGRNRETFRCFWIGQNYALLPAFGSFTGNHVIRPERDDEVFVIAEDEVVWVSGSASKKTKILYNAGRL
jgi:DNA ligase-associated metallophosphoesterase